MTHPTPRTRGGTTRTVPVILVIAAIVIVALAVAFFFGLWPFDDDDQASSPTTTPNTTIEVEGTPDSTVPPTTVAPDTSATVAPTAPPTTVTPVTATPATAAPTVSPTNGTSTVVVAEQSNDSLSYPMLVAPDPSLQPVFPDVQYGNRPALVGYESPFEDADFCDSTPCSMDVPQYYARIMSAGQITIPELGIDCLSTDTKGCLVIVLNHFGETAMYRNNVIDHGFTVAGIVWDMSTPEMVTLASQALVDHSVGRMLPSADGFNQGANCGTIDGCDSIEWHVVVIGNRAVQIHWTGIYAL